MSDGEHIFISYSRQDGDAQAERLETALKARGFSVWRDVRNIESANDFTADIERGIEGASHVVVCVTPDSKRDDSYVRREIQYGLLSDKPVIPLRFADMKPHLPIINHEWIDLFKDWNTHFERLCFVLNGKAEAFRQRSTSSDPFRQYVESLYKRVVLFLKQTVIQPIDLTSEETLDAVNTPPRQPSMIDLFFTAHGIGEEKTTKRPPFPTFVEGFNAYEGRILLLGEPGAGKTITLMAFARDAAAKRLADPNAPLPLLGLISSWDAKNQTPFADWLAVSVAGIDSEDIQHEIEQGKALLLLDGLDELGGEREEQNPPSLRHGEDATIRYDPRKRFVGQLPVNNQIVVTCRVKDYETIGQKIALRGAVTLRPLDEKQMQIYLAEQPELWAAVQADDKLREMLMTPLLLSFFAFAYRDDLDGTERQQLANFSNTPGDLRDKIFETYVRKRYEHEERKYTARRETIPFKVQFVEETLGAVAANNISGWFATGNLITIEDISQLISSTQANSFVEIACDLNLLRSSQDGSFYFIHLLLRDYFAFRYTWVRLDHPDSEVRARASVVMGELRDNRAIDPLIVALDDSTSKVRSSAAIILGQFGDPRAVKYLIKLLNDKSEYNRFLRRRVCDTAAKALMQIGTPEALEAVRVWQEQQIVNDEG